MYNIKWNEMVYWFKSEDQFKAALGNKRQLLMYSDLAFNLETREIVKCRYDLEEIISSWMYRRSHEDNMGKVMENE